MRRGKRSLGFKDSCIKPDRFTLSLYYRGTKEKVGDWTGMFSAKIKRGLRSFCALMLMALALQTVSAPPANAATCRIGSSFMGGWTGTCGYQKFAMDESIMGGWSGRLGKSKIQVNQSVFSGLSGVIGRKDFEMYSSVWGGWSGSIGRSEFEINRSIWGGWSGTLNRARVEIDQSFDGQIVVTGPPVAAALAYLIVNYWQGQE